MTFLATEPLSPLPRATKSEPPILAPHKEAQDNLATPNATADVATELFLEALRAGKAQVFCARGGSMWPSIPDGTLVELECLKEAPSLLDVVLLTSSEGAFLLHRIRGINANKQFLLLGDHCSRPDGWFPLQQLVARARRMHRGAGWEPIPPPKSIPPLWRRALQRSGKIG